ncbi:MAG: VOC family protein [Hyphomicrobiaceae bacterium]
MIAYTLLGTNDLEKSAKFYDALLAEVGGQRASNLSPIFKDMDRMVIYAGAEGTPFFGISEPYDQQPANVGNGSFISLGAKDSADVDRLYAKAIELGATCEGKPGARKNQNMDFYAGYFRDPDGNKLNFFSMG